MSCLFVCTLGSGAGGGAAVALPHSLPRRRRRPASPARPAALVSVLTASGRPCDDFRIGAGACAAPRRASAATARWQIRSGTRTAGAAPGAVLRGLASPRPSVHAPRPLAVRRPTGRRPAAEPCGRPGDAATPSVQQPPLPRSPGRGACGGLALPAGALPLAARHAHAQARARADRERYVPARRRRPHGAARN